MSIRIRSKAWLVVGLALALGLSIVAASSSAGSNDVSGSLASDQFSVSSPADPAEIRAVAASHESAFRFAAESVLPGNSAPQSVSEIGVASMPGGAELAVAKIGQAMCVMHAADAGCGEAYDVVAGRLFGARPRGCGAYWVFGLVPDGIEQVQIDGGNDGKIDEILPVVDNVYEGVLRAESSVAVGIDASGVRVFETQLPLDYYAETNGACNH